MTDKIDRTKKLFEKIKDLLMYETFEEFSDLLCSYLALRYAAHHNEFDNLEHYLDVINKKIVDDYFYNINFNKEIKIKNLPPVNFKLKDRENY